MKIKHQLLLTHGLLVLLSLIIVSVNIMTYKNMYNDAIIINKSGKLRALSYNMSQISNLIGNQQIGSNRINLNENLRLRMDEFDSILNILSKNNQNGIRHEQTILKLERISKEWTEMFRPLYQNIINDSSTESTIVQINGDVDSFVNNINEMVTLYSAYSTEKVYKALFINAGLVIIIIILTIYSFTSTNKRIRRPMNLLIQELKELSLIDDELSRQLKTVNTDEITEMTHYFNEMMFDHLTKAFNRRSGLAKLSKMLQYGDRRNAKMSLCFIDINGLKEVNDQLGHKLGDELIVSVVECVKHEILENDFVIRMGGDEFLIVFNGIDINASEKVWERIKKCYQSINEQESRPYLISVSHGIVEYNNYEKSEIDLLIKNADDKMYAEKKYIKEELGEKAIRVKR